MSDAARARFQLVESIFRAALDASPAERATLIDARTDDAEIRAEVRELLDEDERAATAAGSPTASGGEEGTAGGARHASAGDLESAIDALVARASMELTGVDDGLPADPERIAGYRIIGEIGRGGMGVVYEAEQDEPRRRVALKLVAAGLASPTMAERFRREARALGRLDHPGIARILEAGTFDGGAGALPFFAMEFIDGRPIVAALEGADLSRRLTVLSEVADAVHHAHQRGVVHRDLKPANVLVDEAGRPRVVDFGVARLLDPDEDLAMLQTISGQLVGTPAYMSPEQAAGDAAAVDARTDIHALGVLAHEVLSGRRPLDLDGRSFDEQLRRVREQAPRRLGRTDGVPRDVALVVARALEKDPARRHASAAALAEDLRAARDGRPVSARPASAAYLVSRAVARHPVRTALAAGLAGTALAAGIMIVVLLSRSLAAEAEARDQLARASREADIARGVRAFLVEDVLLAVHPELASTERVTVDQLVDAAATGAVERFADRPVVGREVLRTLAEIDLALGRDARAARHMAAAATLPPEPDDRADPYVAERAEAFDFVRAGVLSRTNERAAAMETYRRILADRTERLGPEDPATLRAMSELARMECQTGDVATGLERYRQLLGLRERVQGPGDPATLSLRTQIGFVLLNAGRFEEALDQLRAAASDADRILGPEHWNTINARINLGETRRSLGDLDGALSDFARAREGFDRRGTAPDTARVIALDMNVGLTLMELDRLDEAEPMLRGALDRAEANGESETSGYQAVLHNLGALQMLRGRYPEAEATLREVLDVRQRLMGSEDLETLLTLGLLGEVQRRGGRPGDAATTLERTWNGLVAAVGADHQYARSTARRLAQCHEGLGDEDAAASWAARAEAPADPPPAGAAPAGPATTPAPEPATTPAPEPTRGS